MNDATFSAFESLEKAWILFLRGFPACKLLIKNPRKKVSMLRAN